jgi:hypothetical protein
MSISDHYRGGQTERMVVTIVTVDPASGLIEGVGRDAAVIQIQAGFNSAFFRMPFEREQWIVKRENGIWQLESLVEVSEWPKKQKNLQMGEALINGTKVWLSGGAYLTTNSDLGAALGSVVSVYEQPDEPLAAGIGDIWVDTDQAAPNVPNNSIPRVTSLPPTPFDGQEIRLTPNGGAIIGDTYPIWHLRWDANRWLDGKQWEFLGGTPIFVRDDTDRAYTSTGAWQGTPGGVPLQITAPYAGEYDVYTTVVSYSTNAPVSGQIGCGVGIGATAPTAFAHQGLAYTAGNVAASAHQHGRVSGVTAGALLRHYVLGPNATDIHPRGRLIQATPVRIG